MPILDLPKIYPTFTPETQPAQVYLLEPDNTNNGTLIDFETRKETYQARTTANFTKTSIRYFSGDTLADIEWREFRSDLVEVQGREKVKLKKWLRHSGTFFWEFPVMFEEKGEMYIWKSNILGHLSLYLASDQETPIAWFERSRKWYLEGKGMVLYPAFLALHEDAVDIQDIVVATFFILEKKQRMNAKADSLASGRLASEGSNPFAGGN
ncbi:hypothetical protein BDQ17DRAFT_1430574 [Cyathus striatus]|nr:hypothetical protein BDQ17DRAFT_1430574 [Cyathus striatus]